jgi:hypothetical protein
MVLSATVAIFGCCPYQKVHLVAHRHIPPCDLNCGSRRQFVAPVVVH